MAKAGLIVVATIALAGCGTASPDTAVKTSLAAGAAEIRDTPDTARLDRKLGATIARLRAERPGTDSGRSGRALAIAGFVATRRGLETQLSMRVRDSGKLEAAVRDARRADRYLSRGARLLRAAGRALGISIGLVNGR